MAAALRILVLADSASEAASLERTLGDGHRGATWVRVEDEASARARLAEEPFDILVASVAGLDPAAFSEGERAILEGIASGRPLPELLEQIVLLVEARGEGMLCSILLVDGERGQVRHGA